MAVRWRKCSVFGLGFFLLGLPYSLSSVCLAWTCTLSADSGRHLLVLHLYCVLRCLLQLSLTATAASFTWQPQSQQRCLCAFGNLPRCSSHTAIYPIQLPRPLQPVVYASTTEAVGIWQWLTGTLCTCAIDQICSALATAPVPSCRVAFLVAPAELEWVGDVESRGRLIHSILYLPGLLAICFTQTYAINFSRSKACPFCFMLFIPDRIK